MKTNYTIKNFAKRVMMAITIVLFAGNAWGATTDVSTITSKSYEGLTKFWSTSGDASNYEATRGAQWYGNTGTTFTATSYTNVTSISIECAKSSSGAGTITITAGASSKEITSFSTTKTTETLSLGSSYTGTITITVNATNNSLYLKSISVTYTPVARTVNFSATSGTPASTSLTEAGGGTGVTLPNVTPDAAVTAAGWGFYGWAEAAVGTETTTAPTIVGKAGETYYPEANTTLYAVYAKGEYTKVTSTSEITSGGNYLIAGFDSNNNKMYVMTDNYYYDEDDTEAYYLSGYLLGTSPSNTYSPADINANWVCSIVINSNKYYIKNKENKYIDVDLSNWITSTYYSGDDYTFIYGDNGYCTIKNNYASKYLVVYVGGDFGRKTSEGWDKMLLYKETTTPKYVSAPCLNIATLSAGTETNATISSFSDAGVQTCSSTAADRQVTITVAAATGYEFLSTARLTFAKTSGTATAEYVSGPTGTGPYTWVYQFSKDDSGAGTFSITSATPKSYIITLNGNDATTEGTENVTATYNSTTLSASITNPKKKHYMFQGWYSGSGGTGNLVINKDGELQANVAGYTGEGGVWTKDGATTLYAKWTEHSYTNYRTKCCDDPGFSFTDENDDPVTEYTIVREDLASASAAVEIGCNYTSANTEGAITWHSTRRAALGFPATGAYTWTTPYSSQPTGLNIDIANKKISASATGVWTITISQADGETTYCPVDAVVTVRVMTVDKFVDAVNGNFSGEAQRLEDTGNGIVLPTEATFTINDGCSDGVTRRLVGWIKASDLATYASSRRVDMIDDLKTSDPATNKVIAPGTKVQATGVTWYAVWGVEKL